MENCEHKHIEMVLPLPNYVLYIAFDDGICKVYDMKPVFKHPKLESVFKELFETKGLFDKVKVGRGGYGVVWNERLDFSCDDLYYNGITVDVRTPKSSTVEETI